MDDCCAHVVSKDGRRWNCEQLHGWTYGWRTCADVGDESLKADTFSEISPIKLAALLDKVKGSVPLETGFDSALANNRPIANFMNVLNKANETIPSWGFVADRLDLIKRDSGSLLYFFG